MIKKMFVVLVMFLCLNLSVAIADEESVNDNESVQIQIIEDTLQQNPQTNGPTSSIGKMVGSGSYPIVDPADISDPNFTGQRYNNTPQSFTLRKEVR